MKRALGIAATALAVTLTAVAPSANAAMPVPAAPVLLYSALANSSTVTVSAYTTSITLPGDSPTTWFTDRPARKAGMTTLAALASRWKAAGFEKSAPNAAIVMHQDGASKQVVVTLSRPRIEGSLVTFTATPLPKAKVLGMASSGAPAAGNYGNTELFIDGADPSTTTTRTYSGDCYTVTVVTTTTDANGNKTQTSSTQSLSGISDEYNVCKRLHLGGKTING